MAPLPPGFGSILVLILLVAGVLAWVVSHYGVLTDLRTARRVLRLDLRALLVGAVLLVGAAGLWVSVATLSALHRSSLTAALLLGGVAGVTVAVANLDWYLASRSLPVVRPDDVEPGPVQVAGTVDAPEDPCASAVTQTDCVAYRAVTREERAVAGRGYASTRWVPRSVAFGSVPFRLEGADVTVDAGPDAFPLLSPTSRLVGLSPAADTLAGLERTVPAEPGATVPITGDLDRGARPRPREYSERRVDPGDEVYVLGTVVESTDGIRIVDDPDGPPLVVVRCSADEATAHARRMVVGFGAAGLASLAAALVLAGSIGV